MGDLERERRSNRSERFTPGRRNGNTGVRGRVISDGDIGTDNEEQRPHGKRNVHTLSSRYDCQRKKKTSANTARWVWRDDHRKVAMSTEISSDSRRRLHPLPHSSRRFIPQQLLRTHTQTLSLVYRPLPFRLPSLPSPFPPTTTRFRQRTSSCRFRFLCARLRCSSASEAHRPAINGDDALLVCDCMATAASRAQ